MTQRRDPLAEQEAQAAAAEAGSIGGEPTREQQPDVPHDPAMQPVYEGGGGESEGFELAEEELRENAEHGPAVPGVGVKAVRAETDRETEQPDPATYGEPDREPVSERRDDPDAR